MYQEQQQFLFSNMSKHQKKKKLPKAKELAKGKSDSVRRLIAETIYILSELGIPMESLKQRRRERTAMAFLALADVKKNIEEFSSVGKLNPLRSRAVLEYWNKNFEENLKDSSYDDVRSENLDFLVLGGVAFNSGDINNASKNDARRGFSLTEDTINLLKKYNTEDWKESLNTYIEKGKTLREELTRQRNLKKVQITLPDGFSFGSNPDKHNILQKAIVEEFLPIFAKDPQVLYIGDASNREIIYEKEKLKGLGFYDISHSEMPDVIVYDKGNDWILLIEAYHSTGEWDEERVLRIKRKLPSLINKLVFVTAFLDRDSFRSKASNIAWETEVWVAENPEHLIHFNGHKFLGPYKQS